MSENEAALKSVKEERDGYEDQLNKIDEMLVSIGFDHKQGTVVDLVALACDEIRRLRSRAVEDAKTIAAAEPFLED